MELEGHPTQDIIEELQRRGATLYDGTGNGPDLTKLREGKAKGRAERGLWLMLTIEAFDTDVDEPAPF